VKWIECSPAQGLEQRKSTKFLDIPDALRQTGGEIFPGLLVPSSNGDGMCFSSLSAMLSTFITCAFRLFWTDPVSGRGAGSNRTLRWTAKG
jgi:hypothetical protein